MMSLILRGQRCVLISCSSPAFSGGTQPEQAQMCARRPKASGMQNRQQAAAGARNKLVRYVGCAPQNGTLTVPQWLSIHRPHPILCVSTPFASPLTQPRVPF